MRVLVQRVNHASVSVEGKVVGNIQKGYCIFVGFTLSDTQEILPRMVKKLIGLRIFDDSFGKTNLNLESCQGSILSISQFTLYADTSHGNRPSFTSCMNPQDADALFQSWNNLLKETGVKVETGIFQTDMKVSLENDGPFTVMLEL